MESQRLALSELELADAPFILELLTSRGFKENIGDRGVRDLAGAEGYIARAREGYAANGFGLWRCDEANSGQPAGLCGLVKREGLDHPDIGYAFLEGFWGGGLATEAASMTLHYARHVLGLRTVVAITVPTNLGSIAVLKKIGMQAAGTVKLPSHESESSYFVIDWP